MKSTDRFLAVIVVGLVLLAGVALVMARRAPEASYRPENGPADAAYNYLLSLAKDDDERTYAYLASTLPGRPASLAAFREDKLSCSWCFDVDAGGPAVEVTQDWLTGDDAGVTANLSYFDRGGLFESVERRERVGMILRLEAGAWKLVRSERFWNSCWSNLESCDKGDPRRLRAPERSATP